MSQLNINWTQTKDAGEWSKTQEKKMSQLNISYDLKNFKRRLANYCEARSCSSCPLGAYSIHCFTLLPEVLDIALKCAYGKDEVCNES